MTTSIPTTDRPQTMLLRSIVEATLDRDEVKYQRSGDGTTLEARFNGDTTTFSMLLMCHEEFEQLIVCTILPLKVPEARRGAVAELVARINYGTRIGHLVLDMRDGEVGFRTGVDVEGGQLTEAMVRTMMTFAYGATERHFPTIAAVALAGVDPETALANL